MRRFILTLAVFLSALAIAAPAAAGGWAVSTLDALPAPEPGEPIEIGFTIRAHGVTPVTVEDGPVGIEIVTLDGTATFFEAIADGPVGHYVATVVFPAAGDYRWAVSQGWYRSDRCSGRRGRRESRPPARAGPSAGHKP